MKCPLKSAHLKLNRASEHIANFSEVLRNDPPFAYILETDTETNRRATYVKYNESAMGRLATIAGDAIGNLRESLDHAYWEILSGLIDNSRAGHGIIEKDVQFPFSERLDRLQESPSYRLSKRLIASKIGSTETLTNVLAKLKPHFNEGGDQVLFLVNKMKIIDKHRLLIPVEDNKTIVCRYFSILINDPTFPTNIGTLVVGGNWRDVTWISDPKFFGDDIGESVPSAIHKFEKVVDIPIDVFFSVAEVGYRDSAIRTLNAMRDTVRSVLKELEPFSPFSRL